MWVEQYTRPDLKEAQAHGGIFKEIDLTWVNPRAFHRKLISELEDLGYVVASGRDETFELKKEVLGTATGTVVSRVTSSKTISRSGRIAYKPFARNNVVSLGILALILFISGLLVVDAVGSFSIFLVLGSFVVGYVAYRRQKEVRYTEFPVSASVIVRILTQGEVTERRVTRDQEETTELQSQLTVSLGGSLSIQVTGELYGPAMDAILRAEYRAVNLHSFQSSGLQPLMNPETNKEFNDQMPLLSEHLDQLIARLSRTAEERPVSTDVEPKEEVTSEAPTSDAKYSMTDLENSSPKEFEDLMAKVFESMGYSVENQPHTGDFGADIIIRTGDHRYLVQLKKYAEGNNVGAPEVQKTLGSMPKHDCEKAFLITTSGFTPQAEEQAKDAPIDLIDGKELEALIADYRQGRKVTW